MADANGPFDEIVCCGDLVGYNAQPARVVDWTRENCAHVIRGNHDKVVAGLENLDWFNDVAQAAARWTIHQLNAPQLDYLQKLKRGPIELEHFHIWHGSPQDEDQYITTAREAVPCFSHFTLPLAFFGHTHLEGGFFSRHGRVGSIPMLRKQDHESLIELQADTLYMVNPGSVGQPRDGDPRAAYAIYDSVQKTVSLRRVEYAVAETAQEIRRARLPEVLALRLFQGV